MLFARARAAQTWPDNLAVKRESSLSNLDAALAALSTQSLAPHFYELERLAQDPSAQQFLGSALARLGAFGKDGVPALLHLIEAGLGGGPTFYRNDRYQRPYLAGLEGLCRAGESGASALPELKRWLAQQKVPVHAGYGSLLIQTFTRLGEDVRALWPDFHALSPDATVAQFRQDIKRAETSGYGCQW